MNWRGLLGLIIVFAVVIYLATHPSLWETFSSCGITFFLIFIFVVIVAAIFMSKE